MARLDAFLELVCDQGASDLHFHAGAVPLIRHDGDLVPLPFRVLSRGETRRFLVEILDGEQRQRLQEEQDLDLIYELPGRARFRANIFHQCHGMGAVFRVIPAGKPTLDELMLPASVRALTRLANGLVLVTGPTGSGKTTTLAAMVHEINRTSGRHIITIEDPIEFVHEPVRSVVTQRQVGEHAASFASALRSALREAPDVIVVGEMRDVETIGLAVSAAETGTLVFGTLHTNSAAKAVNRIVDAVPGASRDQMRGALSVLLRGVVAQRLVKRATGEGRVAAVEVLLQSHAIANMIRENKLHQLDGFLQSVSFEETGMQSLDHALLRLARAGLVEPEEALRAADYPEELRRALAAEEEAA